MISISPLPTEIILSDDSSSRMRWHKSKMSLRRSFEGLVVFDEEIDLLRIVS